MWDYSAAMADTASNLEHSDHSWTARQREVLDLMARGKTNPEIAAMLGISLAGAKWHVSEVLSILGVDSREEAAAYWRSANSLPARGRRWLAGLLSLVSFKAAAGAVGFAAVAGAGLVAVGPGDGGMMANQDRMAAYEPAVPPTPEAVSMTVITSIELDDGSIVQLLGARTDRGICMEVEREPAMRTDWCMGSDPIRVLHAGFSYSHPSIHHGAGGPEADHVEVSFHDGTTLAIPVVTAPPSLGIDWRFYLFAAPRAELVGTIRAVDADGNVIEEYTLYDPPGTPQRVERPAPLEMIDARWSGRADQSSGTIPFPGGHAGASVPDDGGTYRFLVEHDGTTPSKITLWCQTGIMPLVYEDGPDSAGNGTIVARVPRDSAACFFRTEGFDGNLRIVGLAAESEVGVSPEGWKGGP